MTCLLAIKQKNKNYNNELHMPSIQPFTTHYKQALSQDRLNEIEEQASIPNPEPLSEDIQLGRPEYCSPWKFATLGPYKMYMPGKHGSLLGEGQHKIAREGLLHHSMTGFKSLAILKYYPKNKIQFSSLELQKAQTEVELSQKFVPFTAPILGSLKYDGSKGGSKMEKIMMIMPKADQDLGHFVVKNSKFLSTDMRASIALDMCAAVKAFAEQGYIHRDIKLDNFLVFRRNGRLETKIADLESALQIEYCPPSSIKGKGLGTAGYLCTEYVSNMILKQEPYSSSSHAFKVDIFALGNALYSLFTDKLTYSAAKQHQALHDLEHSLTPVQQTIDNIFNSHEKSQRLLLQTYEEEKGNGNLLNARLLKLFHSMMATNPAERPHIQQVESTIKDIFSHLFSDYNES